MITLNLLPDIKKEYLKSQRIKRLFLVSSLLVSAAFVAITVLLGLFVFGAQNVHLNGVQDDIDEALSKIQSEDELSKIITIQKQLGALPGLHDNRPAANRLSGYFGEIIPSDITLSNVEINFGELYTAELIGAGPDPKAINTFVDTIKNATFTFNRDGVEYSIQPFTSVVLDTITVDEDETSYAIELVYDSALFDDRITDGELTIPKITSSPSVQGRPVLFQELQDDSGEDN